MPPTSSMNPRDWQRRHYVAAGKQYGAQHFTQADTPYTAWILDRIASVSPNADAIGEIGAGTCVFASLLGRKLQASTAVVCYEPVKELIEASTGFDNVEAVCGDALDFAGSAGDNAFDLVFTKDTAHHFPRAALDDIHAGICRKLRPGGRYLMVVRTPPRAPSVPVGSIACARWGEAYTPLSDLLAAMRRVRGWREVEVTQWTHAEDTNVREWIDGVRQQNAWSIFSALGADEIVATVNELEDQFAGLETFPFLHQYDVAVFENDGGA